jgi:hypothetical protein
MKMERRCENCEFWDNEAKIGSKKNPENFGLCRIRSPLPVQGDNEVNGRMMTTNLPGWPIIGRSDWCGEFKEKEND